MKQELFAAIYYNGIYAWQNCITVGYTRYNKP